eukprot:scaffold45906_cov15-Tisochrysis_lutea.AAC.2
MSRKANKHQQISTRNKQAYIAIHCSLQPEKVEVPAEEGCYIKGLYMEGARWDSLGHVLADSRPKELFTDCPMVCVCACLCLCARARVRVCMPVLAKGHASMQTKECVDFLIDGQHHGCHFKKSTMSTCWPHTQTF